jgi:phosphoglycolate phosphatase-like HAD superfamily hydrolase
VTLILFDIDGTLTATNAADAKCYEAAFLKTFGIPLPTTDWSVYQHCTDSGIMHEVLQGAWGRRASDAELGAFERAFVVELEGEYARNPGAFSEIPGAREILEAIEARPDMRAAIATGGMRASACYKLSRIGVDALRLPAGFANDSTTREGIVECAIARADGVARDLVYVGDGPWDVKTSAALGLRFIGIVGDASPERLYAQGAEVCIESYGDPAKFFEAVRTAPVPSLQPKP